jgi:hypothetical protein
MFNTTINITGSGQMNVNSPSAINEHIIYGSNSYPIYYDNTTLAGSWRFINYSLSNYGTYSQIYVSGNVSN